MEAGALAGYRVLDLTTELGWMCGKVLADLGADVIKIEPPGGDPGRLRGPFYGDNADPDTNSLHWLAYNTGKRGVTLDLSLPRGQELLREMVREADFVVESFAPGAMEALGLGYAALQAINPQLIMASITPFGQQGPYSTFHTTDLVSMAMGGFMELTGEGHGRPVRITVPQAALHAGVEAAVGMMLAHAWRERTGEGQHVDVSAHECVVWTLMLAPGFLPCLGTMPERNGPSYNWVGYPRRLNFPCADGHVSIFLVGDIWGGPSMQALVNRMKADDMAPPFMAEKDWLNWNIADLFGAEGAAESQAIDEAVMAFTRTKTKQELYDMALHDEILLAPVSNVADLCTNEQLRDRGYFVPVAHPELHASFDYPGAFGKFSRTPCRPPVRAPRHGEHTRQVLQDVLKLGDEAIETLIADGVASCRAREETPMEIVNAPRRQHRPVQRAGADGELPLSGIRVIDLTWIGVGPITTKYLADHGAEVIRIESWAHPDGLRYGPPHMDGEIGENRSYFFAACNTSKYSITLNLTRPEARELVKQLIATADVVTESYTPNIMSRWGLDYDSLRQLKPDLIMMSTCMQGQTGPHALYPGFGNLMAGLLGFYELTGWPDGEAMAVYGAYTDFVAPRFAALSLLAALDERRRSGQGQYIDLAQSEASLHFLSPALLDYTANGRVMQRQGNRDPHMAPHGAYPCQGASRWCAIAVTSDVEWQLLCQETGHPAWGRDARFTTLADRLKHADELDALLAEWTRTQRAEDVMTRLQSVGIPAGVVQNIQDLRGDPQLAHREFWVPLDHSEIGRLALEGHQFRLSSMRHQPRFARPEVGEHNAQVLGGILGLSAEEIARLEADEVIY
ncbi:CaiB/BaiF CoA transferase family protein [Candidatus Entotheonella palauensis]|uniref:CaiB/BaiF CoA transferase family protein n=1 Tax=Candidatus Entotheonella palauensis TaxID=93172 RepID=UPI000B7C8DE0|nr:CoA transferase [Candidatus Entotheonella palauensis]